ncbi:uncharacterized protein VICG_00398 [Vittaforma corneae ATCC 50505]|uniref:Uncharacterized protein n=1 Tax=Vittaforma corneae (strain ATCC 50505) TaxID=993615 RepID=L2GP96_VITCO|nr:uncharacterized protein VICG_00398 [Vittaforma corneae ATCC 50505]ELA42646.1 hypothetical protein VICG_00398 [Vittaforma corneae ATCC 50505]
MSLQKTRKISKSELILRITDPKTRKTTLESLKRSMHIKIPKSYFTSEERNSIISEMNASKKEKPVLQDQFDCRGFVKICYNKPKHVVERSLKYIPLMPTDLCFEDQNMQIFYLSVILRQCLNLKTEYNLMLLLETLYCEATDRSFLKYCVCRISKKTLVAFLQSNICNFKLIKEFVGFLAPKLQPNVVEAWFENDFEFIDELFRNMDVMKLRHDLPFDNRAFDYFLQFKIFRKAIFNDNMSKKFIIEMKEYANRDDFEYFYRQLGIARKLNACCKTKPKDNSEFVFFNAFDKKNQIYSNLLKIRHYQTRIGHNAILNVFINNNVRDICEYVNVYDVVLSIIEDTIVFNSARIKSFEGDAELADKTDYQEAKLLNDTLFGILKKNEDVFRTVVRHFYHPKDQLLQDLLTGHFNFTARDATKYINFGYENELMIFYRTKPVQELLELVDDWNREFFLKLFCSIQLDAGNAVPIMNFIQKSGLTPCNDLIVGIYDKILDISSIQIFDSLAESLKIIYVLRNKDFRREFVTRLLKSHHSTTHSSLCYSAWIYEIFSVDSALRASFVKEATNKNPFFRIAVLENIEFDPNNIIESLFTNSFILKQDALYLFAENFERLLDQILKTLSKEEIMSLSEKDYVFRKYFVSKASNDNRIRLNLENDVEFGTLEKISFVMSYNLSNRYLCYIIFDKILHILTSGTSTQRMLVLTYINPLTLTKTHILKFINALIPLLNSSNSTVCKLSKVKFNQIRVETIEVQNILSEIVQTFLDRSYFKTFLQSFKSIQFNNYLCFNSLNILLQLFLRSLDENTIECFNVLKRLINIIKEKDIKHVSNLVFRNMSLFVVSNNYSTLDALEVASQFCFYTQFEDFDVLLQNLNSLRICNYLVEILKMKGDSALNDKIICHALSNAKAHGDKESSIVVEPAFVAAACELAEFSKHLNVFIPLIKKTVSK